MYAGVLLYCIYMITLLCELVTGCDGRVIEFSSVRTLGRNDLCRAGAVTLQNAAIIVDRRTDTSQRTPANKNTVAPLCRRNHVSMNSKQFESLVLLVACGLRCALCSAAVAAAVCVRRDCCEKKSQKRYPNNKQQFNIQDKKAVCQTGHKKDRVLSPCSRSTAAVRVQRTHHVCIAGTETATSAGAWDGRSRPYTAPGHHSSI